MMIPRGYQIAAHDAVFQDWKEHRSTLLEMATGTGKTVVFSMIAKSLGDQGKRVLVLAHRDELIRQAVNKMRAATGIECAIEKADERGDNSMFPVVVASVQTLMREKRLARFHPEEFAAVITDECFPAGTLVDGRPIETFQIGDRIRAFDHAAGRPVFSRVTKTFKSRPAALIRVSFADGRKIVCTPGHPFWVFSEFRYRPAYELQCGVMALTITKRCKNAKDVQGVLKEVQFGIRSKDLLAGMRNEGARTRKEGSGCDAVRGMQNARNLRRKNRTPICSRWPGLLFAGVQKQGRCPYEFRQNGGDEPQARIAADEGSKPDAQCRDQSQGCREVAGQRVEAARASWEREHDGAATSACLCLGMGHGGGCQHGGTARRGVPAGLQGGRGERGAEDRRGGGRKQPQDACTKSGGCQEDRETGVARVEGVEVLEPGSDGRFSGLCPDGFVYNVEVADHHNYFAEGVLVHNCHHSLSDSYQKVYKRFSSAKMLGVTATPDRGDKRNLGKVFENICFKYVLRDAVADGNLARIKALTIPLSVDLRGVGSKAGDYDETQIGDALEPYLARIADEVVARASDRKSLAFLPLRVTSRRFVELLRARGVDARHVDGDSDDREDVKAWLKSAGPKVCCNAMLFTEGFDEPSIDCVIPLRITKSRSLYTQMVGRGTRLFAGKESLLLLDFLWQTEKHDLCKPCHLIAERAETMAQMTEIQEEQAKSGCEQMDLLDLEKLANDEEAKKRHEALAKALKDQERKKSKLIDPLMLGVMIGDSDLADYEPIMKWEEAKATDAQLRALQRFGIAPETVTCKGHASKLMTKLMERSRMHMASIGKLRVLTKYGYGEIGAITDKEANKLMDNLKKANWNGPERWSFA